MQGVNFKAEISPDNPNKCLVEYTAFGEVATGVSFTFPDYIKHRFHVGFYYLLKWYSSKTT